MTATWAARMTFSTVFYELAAILVIAGVIGVLALKLRQPLIISYIVTGIVAGPAVLGWASGGSEIKLLSSIGIAVLLFVVGLKLDVGLIRSVGPVALATGLGQIVFTALFGFLLSLGLGFAPVKAIFYIAVCLTFSSTIIIVKLLSDKREIDSLHGRIAVGFLVVQDIAVILAMILLTSFNPEQGGGGLVAQAIRLLLVGAAFVLVTVATMRWVMPPLLGRLAQNQELLVLFAVAWAVGLAALADGVGFSKEVGAFLGGVSIASTAYREAIASRLTGLRDFLLLFFFIDLGSGLNLSAAGLQLWPADRGGDHGCDGLPAPHRLSGRAHRGADLGVFADPGGAGVAARSDRRGGSEPGHVGGCDHNCALHLHDPGIRSALRLAGRTAAHLPAGNPIQ